MISSATDTIHITTLLTYLSTGNQHVAK